MKCYNFYKYHCLKADRNWEMEAVQGFTDEIKRCVTMKMKRVKGFTLMELLIVIAIIGVLAAVLAPTMITYYRRSKLKDANADAKMVYNAVQTEMQRFISIDRMRADADKSLFDGMVMIAYNRNGTVTCSTERDSVFQVAATGSKQEEACDAVVEAVQRVVADADTFNWAVYVEDYIVKASISAPSGNSFFVGQCSSNGTMAQQMSANSYDQMLPAPGVKTNELVRLAESVYDAP